MSAIPNDRSGGPSPAAVQAPLRQWWAAHPTATLAEIAAAADRHLAALRTALIAAAGLSGAVSARPDCPAWATPMQQVGPRQRTVRTAQDRAVTGQGPGYRCPA